MYDFMLVLHMEIAIAMENIIISIASVFPSHSRLWK